MGFMHGQGNGYGQGYGAPPGQGYGPPAQGYGPPAYGQYAAPAPAYPYGVQTGLPPVVPSLLAVASGHAWKMLWWSIGGIVGGALLTVVGLALLLFIPFGLILFVAGCVGVVTALIRIADPTGHPAIKPLGPTGPFRMQAIRAVEADLASPHTTHVPLFEGPILLGPTWLVHPARSDLAIVRADDVAAIRYGLVKGQRKLRIFLRSTPHRTVELPLTDRDGDVIPWLRARFPHAC
jgi:hypothetical protein